MPFFMTVLAAAMRPEAKYKKGGLRSLGRDGTEAEQKRADEELAKKKEEPVYVEPAGATALAELSNSTQDAAENSGTEKAKKAQQATAAVTAEEHEAHHPEHTEIKVHLRVQPWPPPTNRSCPGALKSLQALTSACSASAASAFQCYDLDHNELLLNPSELKSLAGDLMILNVNVEAFWLVAMGCDTNRDGSLSAAEFQVFIARICAFGRQKDRNGFTMDEGIKAKLARDTEDNGPPPKEVLPPQDNEDNGMYAEV